MIPVTEAMVQDTDAWYDAYDPLSVTDKVTFIRDTLDFALTDEFLEETDFSIMIGELEAQAGPIAIAPVIEKIRDRLLAFHYREIQYLEDIMVIQGLFLGDLKKTAVAAAYFREDPERFTDYYLTTFRFLVLYGAHDIARTQAEAGLLPLRTSHRLIAGAEEGLAQFLLWDHAQTLYVRRSTDEPLDAAAFVREYRRLWPLATDADADFLYQRLINPKPEPNPSWRHDLQNQVSMRSALFWSFLIEMYEQHHMTFAVAAALWNTVWRFLQQHKGSANTVCFPTEAELDRHLGQLTSIVSTHDDDAFTLLWGLPYVANFLHNQGFTRDDEHVHLKSLATTFQAKLIQALPHDLWQYDYVHRWDPPEGTDLLEWNEEIHQFQESFTAARPESPSLWSLPAENVPFAFDLRDLALSTGPMDPFLETHPQGRRHHGDPKRKSQEKKNRKKSRQKRH